MKTLTSALIAVGALVGCGGGGSAGSNPPGTSAGSTGVVFIADRETNGLDELYFAPSTGGSTTKLSTTLGGQGLSVKSLSVSPDRTRVAFVAGPAGLGDNLNELYAVSVNGGTPLKISSGQDVGGDQDEVTLAFDYGWSPDGQEVAYLAGSGSPLQCFRTRLDGSPARNVGGATADIRGYRWLGSTLVYLARTANAGTLYADGAGALSLVNEDVLSFSVSPAAQQPRIAYFAATASGTIVVSVLADGSGATPISLPEALVVPTLLGSGMLQVWSPDGSKLSLVTHDASNVRRLYVADPTNGSSSLVSGSSDLGIMAVPNYLWSPDGKWLAFIGNNGSLLSPFANLYVASATAGTSPQQLNPAGTAVGAAGFAWSPASARIAYVAGQLYNGVALVTLYTDTPTSSDPKSFGLVFPIPGPLGWSNDGSRLLYVSGPLTSLSLYVANADATNPQLLQSGIQSPNMMAMWSLDDSRVVYRAQINGVNGLFSINPDGSAPANLSAPMVAGGTIRWFWRT